MYEHRSRSIALAPLVAAILGLASLATGARAADEHSPAETAFERLKSLAGTWEAHSTQGWDGRGTIEVIAGGTAILMTSQIDPHGLETMATLIHLDGDRLLLTHYCIAGNQPRLEATAISPDASRIEFDFRDGTNLSSRDEGHMDRAVLELIDDRTYRSRWTWYQDGAERWLEQIEHRRGDAR